MSPDQFSVTTHCNSPPANGVVLFPPSSDPPKGVRVKLTTTGEQKKSITLKADKRADAGAQGLCLSQASIDALGGSEVTVNVRGLSLPEAVFHDLGLFVNVLLAVLSFVLAVLTGVIGYSSVGPEDPPFLLKLAPALLLLGFLIAALTLYKSVKEA
ncbi:MAG TPA: hypothetical protein VLI94_11900 [Solirubrobacterales bacterium]|nr:hypothetical protein [Solirubrobacterales bacterium]